MHQGGRLGIEGLTAFVGLLAAAGAGCSANDVSGAALATHAFAEISGAPIVISQIYGGGGGSAASFQNDFIELHNRSDVAVALTNLSLQYASATGSGAFGASASQLLVLSGTIPAGGYFLARLASSGSVGAVLPTADAVNASLNMSATAGKVALVTGSTSLECNGGSLPCDASALARILDLVGYGNANFREGSAPAGTLSSTLAALRKGAGCSDSNDNLADFDVGPPAPRNSASAPLICSGGVESAPSVVASVPTDGATNVAPGANVTVTFSEPVAVAGAGFGLVCSGPTGSVPVVISQGPTTFVLTPTASLPPGESCQVTVSATAVTDLDSNDPPDQMGADAVFGFTITPAVSGIAVHTVQGAAHISPLVGQNVTVGPAVVTAKRSNGFYMEDLAPDASDATSEGIFVFTSSAPAVVIGDVVMVAGKVSEFRPGCSSCSPSDSAYANLTATELTAPTVTVQSHGHALPAPVALGPGPGERHPPAGVIDDDANGSVETGGTFDAATDGIDFYESLEGMRIALDNPVVVGPTRAFSGGSIEITVLTDGGAGAGLRTPRGGIIVDPNDFNPERITLENSLISAFPNLNVGDSFTAPVVGVVDYDFGNYKVLVSDPLPASAGTGVAPETTALTTASATQLSVASFNAENLDPTDPPAKFARLAGIIVTNLGAPDLLSVEEIQDNNGATDNGVVAANVTLQTLATAISAAGGPAYVYRQIDPVNDQDGGEPGGNIRQALLFRTDRGLGFVDRGSAGSLTPTTIDGTTGKPHLSASPGRIDPGNSAFSSSRKPLAGEFSFRGQSLFVIANHFNSKGGDQPLFGRFQPPTRSSETQRLAQANVLGNFVAALRAVDPGALIVTLGDFNDFSFASTLAPLKSAGLVDLMETLPPEDRYSYVFQGNSQDLDHIFASGSLALRASFDVVHVNAEFWDQVSDHDPNVARFEFGDAPVITSAPITSIPVGGSYVYDVHASGVPAPTYTLLEGPAGMVIDVATGRIDWTAGLAPSSQTVKVRADNGVAPAAVQTFSLQVIGFASVPALSPGAMIVLGLALALLGLRLGRAAAPSDVTA